MCVIVPKKNGINTPAIIAAKNEMVSINQLNYKPPEKYHDTEELVGCNLIHLNYVFLRYVVLGWRRNPYTQIYIY